MGGGGGVERGASHYFVLYPFRTKIFIRHPKTLFATEDAFEVCKHELGGLFCLFIQSDPHAHVKETNKTNVEIWVDNE